MKQIIFILSLFLVGITAFSQNMEKNGTIYIKHPYIDIVNNSMKAYAAQDNATLKTFYADTARFWASAMDTSISIADAIKMWSYDFNYFDSIHVLTVGYPDYLHYI